MPRTVEHRQISPLLLKCRDILRGRPVKHCLRFADLLAARTQPPPEIPGGPYHRTSKIYYYLRDARREVTPPMLVAGATKRIGSGSSITSTTQSIQPGNIYFWDK